MVSATHPTEPQFEPQILVNHVPGECPVQGPNDKKKWSINPALVFT